MLTKLRIAFSPVLAGLLVAAIGLGISFLLASLDMDRRNADARAQAVSRLSLVQNRLSAIVRSTFSPADGLVHLIGIQKGLPPELFAAMAERLIEENPAIRNITVAPDDEVTMVYPLVGNEKALGFRFETRPDQLATVRRARQLGRPLLVGPVKLVQGGEALIERAPVFSAAPDGIPHYWGTISVVAYVSIILADSGISTDPELDFALVGRDDHGELGMAVFGDPMLGGQQPVTADVPVPGDVWQLRAVPKAGWPTAEFWRSGYFQLGILNSLILGFLCWLLVRRQYELIARNRDLLLASTVFENTADGVVITDPGGHIVSVNKAFADITGYESSEAVGRKMDFLQSENHDGHDGHDGSPYAAMWTALHDRGIWQGEIWNRRKNGEAHPEWLTITAVRSANGELENYVGVFSDISAIKRSQEELKRLAHFDPVTDLPNRILFRDRLAQAFELTRRHGRKVAVMLLDLDGFKTVNDSLGHPVGDRLLRKMAERLLETVRIEDTVARLGGDEFALILPNLERGEDAVAVARKILASTQKPFDMSGYTALITTSIGITVFPDDGDEPNALIRNADAAMYRAKEAGRNTYCFYRTEMTLAAQRRLAMEKNIRRGLENREFEVWYQPQLSLASGLYLGAEALVRWRDPERGLVPPGEFIPLAEQTGLIVPLGEQVLDQVCSDARRWLDAGVEIGRLSINVAGPQLYRSDFVATLRQALETYGLPPGTLEIEVTETFMMESPAEIRRILDAAQAMGVTTAIDDFGTGYSSLSYLKELPIDTLKIDRTFIANLPDDPQDIAITRTILALGRSLQFKVIAEGIETPAQRDFLRAEGCAEGQGYLFARPMPPEQFAAWLGAVPAAV